MTARITNEEQAHAELQAFMSARLKEASNNGVLLGGQTHARIAMQNWGNAYRTATSQDEKIRIAGELIDYIERTAYGLKKGAGGKS